MVIFNQLTVTLDYQRVVLNLKLCVKLISAIPPFSVLGSKLWAFFARCAREDATPSAREDWVSESMRSIFGWSWSRPNPVLQKTLGPWWLIMVYLHNFILGKSSPKLWPNSSFGQWNLRFCTQMDGGLIFPWSTDRWIEYLSYPPVTTVQNSTLEAMAQSKYMLSFPYSMASIWVTKPQHGFCMWLGGWFVNGCRQTTYHI